MEEECCVNTAVFSLISIPLTSENKIVSEYIIEFSGIQPKNWKQSRFVIHIRFSSGE